MISALAKAEQGLLREELLKASKLSDNADFSKALQELEQCGFIRKFTAIGKKTKDATFQLIDNYTLFYFDFISENTNGDEHFGLHPQVHPSITVGQEEHSSVSACSTSTRSRQPSASQPL